MSVYFQVVWLLRSITPNTCIFKVKLEVYSESFTFIIKLMFFLSRS